MKQMVIYQKNEITIYKLSTTRTSCFLIKNGEQVILWDTSMGFEKKKIINDMKKCGIKKIDAIFISHAHTDHAANAQALSKLFHCKIYIHRNGVHCLKEGKCPVPKGTNIFGKFIYGLSQKAKFIYNFENIVSCEAVQELTDEVIKKYLGNHGMVLETFGHTMDSISLVVDRKIALVGDVFVNISMQFYPPFADEPKQLLNSWKKLAETGCKLYYPGHGGPVSLKELQRHILHNVKVR